MEQTTPFLDYLGQIKAIYCENDFLIHSEKVQTLLCHYHQMALLTSELTAQSDKVNMALNSENNGYKSLVSMTEKLTDIATSRAKNILSKVANVSTVSKFLSFWSKAFNTMCQILEMASGMYHVSINGLFYCYLTVTSRIDFVNNSSNSQ